MKSLKKATAVLISAVLMLTSMSVLTCFAKEEKPVTFAVASDLHIEKPEGLTAEYPENELYFHARNSGNLYNESMGIFKAFLNQAKEKKVQFIIIPGDMANNGKKEQHLFISEELRKFEKNTGIQVYVTPGNHDFYNSDVASFMEYYSEFGYDEAIETDKETASYTVDLPGCFRLISINSQAPGKDGDTFDDRLFGWVEEQAAQAKKDGRTPIAMMHCPLLDPVPLAGLIMKDFVLRDNEKAAEKFAQCEIPYVFTGHEHGNNITSFTGSNGFTVYDILTTSLSSYPLEYRTVTADSKGMDIKCCAITECDFDYIDGTYTDAQKKLIREDYTEYALGLFKFAIERKIGKYTSADFIAGKLKVENGPLYDAVNIVMPLVDEALSMPLYSKDTDGISVEALAAEASAVLPASEYKSLYDMVSTAVAKIYYGAENMPVESSPEARILVVGLNTMLKYILAEAGNRAATSALNAVVSLIGKDAIDELRLFTWNEALMLGADHSYDVALAVLLPVLDELLVDDELCDRDEYLPASCVNAEAPDKFAEFINKIEDFIKYILNIIKVAVSFPF